MIKYGNINIAGKSLSFFAKALYSNFYLISGYNILFDCGEGISLFLKERVLRINRVFITHHHSDHFGGLMGFLHLRNIVKGGTKNPLRIFYPKKNDYILKWIQYFSSLELPLQYDLKLIGVNDYSEVFLGRDSFIKAYPVKHDNHCFSYALFERNTKLKERYSGENIIQLKKSIDHDELFRSELRCRLFYSGDSYLLNAHSPDNLDIGIFDSTFLYSSDRGFDSHSSLEELLLQLRKKKIKVLLLTHFSQRYTIEEIKSFINNIDYTLLMKIYILHDDKAEFVG